MENDNVIPPVNDPSHGVVRPVSDIFSGLTGEDTRRAGMQRAENTAEERSPGWKEQALEYVRQYAELHQGFHCEHVVAFAASHGFTAPASPRAWGPVMNLAASSPYRYVKSQGLVKKESAASHRTPAVWWKSLVCHNLDRAA